MPYEIATTKIEAALVTLLEAHSPLTALLATKPTPKGGGPAIYEDGDVPLKPLMPYLTIGAWTQHGSHSLTPDVAGSPMASGYGWNCTGQLKVVGQKSAVWSASALHGVMSEVFSALPQGQKLDVTGYGSGWVDEFVLQPAIITQLAGVATYEIPAILRVYVFDT